MSRPEKKFRVYAPASPRWKFTCNRVLSNSSFLGEISPLLARNERLFGCVIRGFRGEYIEQNCERNERRDKYFYFLSSCLSLFVSLWEGLIERCRNWSGISFEREDGFRYRLIGTILFLLHFLVGSNWRGMHSMGQRDPLSRKWALENAKRENDLWRSNRWRCSAPDAKKNR